MLLSADRPNICSAAEFQASTRQAGSHTTTASAESANTAVATIVPASPANPENRAILPSA